MTANALQAPGGRTATVKATSAPHHAVKAPVLPVMLVCLWLAMEIARPSHPFRIPLLCSLGLTGFWLAGPRKQWHPSLTAMMVLLGACVLGIPLAVNQFAAFWTTYALAIIMLTICIPAATALRTMRHLNLYVGTLLVSSTYVGLWAITHSGYGPAASQGGQDENYVSAMMCVALPFTYFGIAARPGVTTRVILLGMGLVYVAATVIGLSRGGFLGMAAVVAFCFWYSPRKLVAIVSTAIAAIAVIAIAPASYWKEIESIGDTHESTADHRLELWAIATREYLHNPVLGVGPGNFKWRISDYQTEEQQKKFGRSLAASAIVHSTYFEILSELGTVGVVSFGTMLFLVFRELRRIERACTAILGRSGKRRLDPRQGELEWARAYALSIQGSLFGYLVCSAFLSTTYFSSIWLLTAVTVALHFVTGDLLSTISADEGVRRARPSTPPVSSSAAGAARTESRPPRLSDMLGRHPRAE